MHRRRFLATAVGAVASATAVQGRGRSQGAPLPSRERWVAWLRRVAEPVLVNLAGGMLKARMPVEEQSGANRASATHLEAVGRLLAGIAPWLGATKDRRTSSYFASGIEH